MARDGAQDRLDYQAVMGKPPPEAPDEETARQFGYRPRGRPGSDERRESVEAFLSGRDPGDEADEVAVVIDGQEQLA